MNDNSHITQEEWVALYSARTGAAERMRLTGRVKLHIAGCPECAALYEKANDLRTAARMLAESRAADENEDAFRAVASWQEPTASVSQGSLFVCVDNQPGRPVFLEETLEASGLANKYALNPEDGGQTLEDDGSALRLTLSEGGLTLCLREEGVTARFLLIREDGEEGGSLASDGHPLRLPLPADDYFTLELTFSSGQGAR